MLQVRSTARSFPIKIMTNSFTASWEVDRAILELPFTEFTAMVNCGDILRGQESLSSDQRREAKTKT